MKNTLSILPFLFTINSVFAQNDSIQKIIFKIQQEFEKHQSLSYKIHFKHQFADDYATT